MSRPVGQYFQLTTAFKALRALPAAKINEYLNRTGDFGDGVGPAKYVMAVLTHQVHREIDKLPQYSLTMT